MKYTILFVDDEPQVLISLSIVFQKDYNVLTAQSGIAALEIIRRTPLVHVIVSDQRMPGMPGVELLKSVKEISPTTMRILLTGYADLDAVIGSINVGDVFRFVNKPWKNDKLRETVRLACQISEKMNNLYVQHQNVQPGVEQADFHLDARLLVVDANKAHLQAIKELFVNDYTVYTASTIEQAFQFIKSTPISVLITEAMIGETDGVDFLAAVREEQPDTVPILLSDSKDAALAVRLINQGRVFRYLIKPFKREVLKTAVQSAVSQYNLFRKRPSMNLRRQEEELLVKGSEENVTIQQVNELLDRARQNMKNRTTY
ncbi:response regulator receiver protein [Chloroherpeton thalassium ATCC 35110]|uniref:Response regulator receiver protein n=1 Tax=Chloroherpeton thalassium (strain ATCC 35110 / GB-78) TaxID=517418 RepID=B3QT63_CHLT3|nr:response regulator [Chloroherpeton thalassium]ACF14162.1 response regulator receiver protein [Chloroherpeton thalassium ATCC 35110]